MPVFMNFSGDVLAISSEGRVLQTAGTLTDYQWLDHERSRKASLVGLIKVGETSKQN